MANNDSASYTLRFNEVRAAIEYAIGNTWYSLPASALTAITGLTGDVTAVGPGNVPATISAGAVTSSKIATGAVGTTQLADHSVIPVKISNTVTDNFIFPHDVTVAHQLFVNPTVPGQTAEITVGNAAAATSLITLNSIVGAQNLIQFSNNSTPMWLLLDQSDTTFLLYDAVTNLSVLTNYIGGGTALAKLTTTQKNALPAVEAKMVYDLTLHAPSYYNGTAWESLAIGSSGAIDLVQFSNGAGGFSSDTNFVWNPTTHQFDNLQIGTVTLQKIQGNNSIVIFPGTDSTTAVQIENAAQGATVVDVDTTNLAVGIGGNPNTAAVLDVQSTTKGLGLPRLTTTQKNAIASPFAGLSVYDTTLNAISYYDGAVWQTVGNGGSSTYVESLVGPVTAINGTVIDATFITLTTGTWLVSGALSFSAELATSVSQFVGFISATAGNTLTGFNESRTGLDAEFNSTVFSASGIIILPMTISPFQVVVVGSTPYYLKFVMNYTGPDPRIRAGFISAHTI